MEDEIYFCFGRLDPRAEPGVYGGALVGDDQAVPQAQRGGQRGA